MSARGVVVIFVRQQNVAQMAFAEYHYVIDAFRAMSMAMHDLYVPFENMPFPEVRLLCRDSDLKKAHAGSSGHPRNMRPGPSLFQPGSLP